MIKQKKRIALLCLALVIGAVMLLFSACENDKDGLVGKVTDAQWKEKLDINIDACKSCTVKVINGANYDKSAAAEYGEWEMIGDTLKIDFENEILYEALEQEHYVPETATFSKQVYENYYFRYKDNYYKYDKESNSVSSSTKVEFSQKAETLTNVVSIIRIYAQPQMKMAFNYNDETKCYDLMQMGTMKMSLQFLESGVKMIMERTSVNKTEESIFDIDNTEVSIPDEIKAKVDEFIASQQ